MSKRYIKIQSNNNFEKTTKYFKRVKTSANFDDIRSIISRCIAKLKKATPKDTGLTSESWEYSIKSTDGGTHVEIYNTNIQNGANIALIIEYGHATANGAWIEGEHFIEPTVSKYYNEILNDTWERMSSL